MRLIPILYLVLGGCEFDTPNSIFCHGVEYEFAGLLPSGEAAEFTCPDGASVICLLEDAQNPPAPCIRTPGGQILECDVLRDPTPEG